MLTNINKVNYISKETKVSAKNLNDIQDSVLKTQSDIEVLGEQYNTIKIEKLDKNGILSMANMGQDVKEAMTGGSVAVVGKNTILNENIVNKQVSHEKTNFLIVGKNLFNKKTVSQKGWYMQYTDGVPTSNQYTTELHYSEFIKITPSSTITISGNLHSYCYFDINKKYISGKAPISTKLTLQVPNNAEYIVLNPYNYSLNIMQLEYGDTVTSYEDFTLDIDSLKANIDLKNTKKELEKLNMKGDTLDSLITFENIEVNNGTATTPKDAISTFTGWAIPIKKSYFTEDLTYFSIYLTAYDNSTSKTPIANVPIILELIEGSSLPTTTSTRKVLKTLATSILKESGKVEFSFYLPLSELEDVFYLGVKSTIPSNLMCWNCKSNGTFSFGEYPAFYTTNYQEGYSYMMSNTVYYADTDFKIGTGTTAKVGHHTHKIEDIEDIGNISTGVNKVKLSLPDKYELIVGDTFELFYKGILLCNNPYNYNIKITCNKGSYYSKKYVFTPTSSDIGTFSLTIAVYDDNEVLLDSKVVSLVIKSKATNPSTIQNVLCVGDSLTSGGVWVSELCRRLTGTSGSPVGDGLTNIKFIGTVSGTNGAKFEGYGGWTYNNYNTNNIATQQYWIVTTANKNNSYQKSVWKDSNNIEWILETLESTRIKVYRKNYGVQMLPTSGILTWVSGGDGSNNSNIEYTSFVAESGNPFWDNEGNKVDFSKYAAKVGVTSIDHCYILLGWNSTGDNETTFKDNARTFINNLRTSFPNCKITLMGLQVPSLDGFGANYGCSWNYYDKLKVVFNMNKWNYELTKEYSNVDFINIAGQFDSENNIKTSTRQVNVRNSKTEIYGANGVHPATEGYLQIADAAYRNVSHKI